MYPGVYKKLNRIDEQVVIGKMHIVIVRQDSTVTQGIAYFYDTQQTLFGVFTALSINALDYGGYHVVGRKVPSIKHPVLYC